MRRRDWLGITIIGLLVSGCAGMQQGPGDGARAALAPTGTLRVAFFAAPVYAVKDPATGELKGLGVDIGKELAKRAGVPFEPRVYKDLAALIDSARSGEWDVALTTIDERRAAVMDFTAPYMLLEQGYLVRAGVSISTMAEVDKAGIKVGVVKKSASETKLSQTLKNVTLVQANNLAELKELLVSEKTDAIAIGKTFLYSVADKLPGSHVLDGSILVERVALGVAKGRDPAGGEYAGRFIEDIKANGLVQNAINRDKLRGVRVAPPK